MSLPADPYAIIPEPLRAVVRDSVASETRLHRMLSIGVMVLATAFLAYLAWYVVARSYHYEVPWAPVGVGIAGLVASAIWLARTFSPDPRLVALHSAGNRITGAAQFVRFRNHYSIQVPMTAGTDVVMGKKFVSWGMPADAPLDALATATEQLRAALEKRTG